MNQKRKYLIIDTETANTIDEPIAYNIGYAVIDNTGKVYEKADIVINEVFFGMRDLMKSAYYYDKIQQYFISLSTGQACALPFLQVRRQIYNICQKYNIKTAIAFNAAFDRRALNITTRFLTKSKYRYFLPYGIEWNCIQNMAVTALCTPKYFDYAIKKGGVSDKGNVRTNAEIFYRFISGQDDFIEEHTALADCMIEKEIFSACIAKHKKMERDIVYNAWQKPQKNFKEFYKKVLTKS